MSLTEGARAPAAHCRPALSLRRCAPFSAPLAAPSRRRRPPPTAAAASQAVITAAAEQQLPAWLQGRGADPKQLTAAVCVAEGGLAAAKAAGKGELLCSVPDSCWVNTAAVGASELGPLVSGQQPWVQLALLLLHERAKGAASEWAPYIAALPAAPNSPVVWSEQELALLAGSQLAQLAQGYRSYFQSKYQELQGGLFASSPALFPPSVFTYDAFLWAVCTVRARVHAPLDGEQCALVPLADLVQHRRAGSSSGWQVESSGLFGRSYAVALKAARELAAGEAVSMDYGPGKSDSQVLLDHGVLDSSSLQPGFALTLELPESDRFFGDKIDILELNGLSQSEEYVLRPDQAPSTTMLAFLRLLNLSGADSFLLESIFRNDVWGHLQLPVSEENERAVYQSMVNGCGAALQGYATSIDEDLALLRGGGLAPGSREEMAVQVRLGEKEALDATLRYFEDRLGRLGGGGLEYYAERRLKGLGLLDDQGNTTWDGFFKDGVA